MRVLHQYTSKYHILEAKMAFVDFDSLVICRKEINYKELQSLMEHFCSYGIRKFIIAYDVDPETEFIATVIYNIRELKRQIRLYKPRGCKVYVAASVLYRRNTAHEKYLRRLLLASTNKIFLRMPPFWQLHEDDFFKSANHLLYKLKYVPVFTRYEDVFNTYPEKLARKIFKTRNAAFCIDLNYLSSPIGTVRLFSAMNDGYGVHVIPSISSDLKDHKHPEQLFGGLKKHFGNDTYLTVCKFLNQSIKRVFPQDK